MRERPESTDVMVSLALLLSKIVHDAQDEHGLRTRHDIGLVLLDALMAEGGEIRPTWRVDPAGSFPFWIGAEQPGRYLVFPLPVEEEPTP